MSLRRATGFTLIELVTIIILIGIVAVVALPRLSGNNVFRERGFHDGVVAGLGYARKVAIASRHFVCVQANGAAGTVTLQLDSRAPEALLTTPPVAVNCTVPVQLPAPQGGCANNAICAPSGVALGNANLIFDPLGQLVVAATPRIVTGDATIPTGGGDIVVNATTGFVR